MESERQNRNKINQFILSRTFFAFSLSLLVVVITIPFTSNLHDREGFFVIPAIAEILIGLGIWHLMVKNYFPKFTNVVHKTYPLNWWLEALIALKSKDYLGENDLIKRASPKKVLLVGVLSFIIGLAMLIFIIWFNYQV